MSQYGALGWVEDKAAVEAVCVAIEAGELGEKRPAVFGAARPQLKGYWSRLKNKGVSGVFLADAELKVRGKYRDPQYQKRGTCVSQGTMRAIMDTWQCQIANKFIVGRVVELAFPVVYGFGRVEIGKGRLGQAANNPNNDGCVGAWAAAGVSRYGICEAMQIGKYDLRGFREDLAIQFGDSGVPAEIEAECAKHKIIAHNCRGAEDIQDALAAQFGVAVCLPRLFGPRNAEGICKMADNGNHCTELSGTFKDRHGNECFTQQQSWGPKQPEGPDVLKYDGGERKLRLGEFGCYAEEIDKYLRNGSGEAWAFEIPAGSEWR